MTEIRISQGFPIVDRADGAHEEIPITITEQIDHPSGKISQTWEPVVSLNNGDSFSIKIDADTTTRTLNT